MIRFLQRLTRRHEQNAHLLRFLRQLDLGPDHAILAVGCGFGDRLKIMRSEGFNAAGVDINRRAVQANRDNGFSCFLPDEFDRTEGLYDVVLMSHIIEHFAPDELLEFMDHYFDRLKGGGHLIVMTPLLWSRFYDDFDHVRPYPPKALAKVFCHENPQAQHQSRNRLELLAVGIRRREFALSRTTTWPANALARCARAVGDSVLRHLYHLSFGLIGHANGWVGLFRKIDR